MPPKDHATFETIFFCELDNVYITTPYLIIDNELITALGYAAKSGVDIKIIVPHIADKMCIRDRINKMERPCAKACGMDAISSDENGKAKIDYDKCVSCGMCLVNCPFGAIVDKGQIFQLIHAMKTGKKVIALVAPAFVGQFGPKASPEKLTAAMKKLGFDSVVEVAIRSEERRVGKEC